MGLALPSALVMVAADFPPAKGFSLAAAKLEQGAVPADPAVAADP